VFLVHFVHQFHWGTGPFLQESRLLAYLNCILNAADNLLRDPNVVDILLKEFSQSENPLHHHQRTRQCPYHYRRHPAERHQALRLQLHIHQLAL
jgi:hypothetical protein